MSNFLFNISKVAFTDGSGLFDWIGEDVMGVLYDNRLTVTPDMAWGAMSSYEVARSPVMTGKNRGTDGSLRGDALAFLDVTTGPGLKIKGLLLAFQSGVDPGMMIANFTDGLDGFATNTDLNLEAAGIDIYARTAASSAGIWIKI